MNSTRPSEGKRSELSVLSSKLHREMRKRREIESRLREMCGNVRVFCRVRPVLPKEDLLVDGLGNVSVYVSGDR